MISKGFHHLLGIVQKTKWVVLLQKKCCIHAFIFFFSLSCMAQYNLVDVEKKIFKTHNGISIEGEIGFLEVPENRSKPESRTIRVKYARLKSLAQNPEPPVVYLEGGGGKVIWQTEDPQELGFWLDILKISDLIFIERRGTDDESLLYVWEEAFPKDFFKSEKLANHHYEKMVKAALKVFIEREVDVTGYTIEEHAKDVEAVIRALNIDEYTLYGFSFGSHIGMTVMKLFPAKIKKAILAGSDAPNQALNFPKYLEDHIEVLAEMVAKDEHLSKTIPNFKALTYEAMGKLEKSPAEITIENPLTGNVHQMEIGAFGLALILRLDIDDSTDIPVIPRLLHTILNEDYSMLQFFAQKRIVFALAISGQGINQQLASGASSERWNIIQQQAQASIFGNVVNFPFSAAKPHWVSNTLSFDASQPMVTDIPTLFITGGLDCRTPVTQVEKTMKGFSNAQHIILKNAGHEQVLWDRKVSASIIPKFLLNKEIVTSELYYSDIHFIKVTGNASGHPALD